MKPNNKAHKKTKIDEPQPDEESKGFIEQQTINDNDNKIDRLGKNVKAIKQLTSGISTQIKSDEEVISKLSSGFDKTKALAQKTLSKMDNFIGQASTSMSTYIALFVIIIVALIFKVAL